MHADVVFKKPSKFNLITSRSEYAHIHHFLVILLSETFARIHCIAQNK